MYYVYILKCSDKSYYTGVTKDIESRLVQHNNGIGSSYTKNKRPVELVYNEIFTNVLDAIAAEKQIKGWSRAKKEALIVGDFDLLSKLARRKKVGKDRP